MRKVVVFLSLIAALSVNLYAITIDRKVELLESAVVKLINENTKLKNAIEINKNYISELENKLKNLTSKKEQTSKNILYGKVTAFRLNVRKKATVKSKIVNVLKKDNLVTIYETRPNKDTTWYKTDNGYVSSNFIDLVYENKKNSNKKGVK
jgi:predicted lysophospholipase L1 biosynthesis ABC-type transport system permease subunit